MDFVICKAFAGFVKFVVFPASTSPEFSEFVKFVMFLSTCMIGAGVIPILKLKKCAVYAF